MRDALARQLVERAMQLDRIGRGQRAVDFALRRHHADGADAGRRHARASLQIWRVKAATDVLPLVPVTAAMVCGWRGKNFAAASASARRAFSTRDESNRAGNPSGRCSAAIATAPAAAACRAKCAPSALAPAIATNRYPA